MLTPMGLKSVLRFIVLLDKHCYNFKKLSLSCFLKYSGKALKHPAKVLENSGLSPKARGKSCSIFTKSWKISARAWNILTKPWKYPVMTWVLKPGIEIFREMCKRYRKSPEIFRQNSKSILWCNINMALNSGNTLIIIRPKGT